MRTVYRAVAERQPDPPAAVVIPPRASAVPSPTADTVPSQRDQHIRMIRDKGRLGWQKAVGYGRRSLGETAVFRYKTIIGRGLRARTLPSQKTEARVASSVLNRMTRLGMPVSQRIALVVHSLSCCGIWHDGDPGAARGAVPPSGAPDEGMLVRVPVRGGTLDGFFDLGPGFEAAPFEGQRA